MKGEHYILVKVTLKNTQVHTVCIHDASTECKTAKNLLGLLKDVVAELEEKWETTVVTVVTDVSGEARKA